MKKNDSMLMLIFAFLILCVVAFIALRLCSGNIIVI